MLLDLIFHFSSPNFLDAVFLTSGMDASATAIVTASAQKVALLCQDIQLTLDPVRIVIGGGIGLAPGYLDQVRALLPDLGARLKPQIVPALCGRHAGAIGAADLAFSAL